MFQKKSSIAHPSSNPMTNHTQRPQQQQHGKGGKDESSDEEEHYYSLDELVEEDIYKLKQKRPYLSILFSLIQTIVLIAMMVKCSIAPFRINPMIGPYPDGLDYWGAKNSFKILNDGESWRLLSPILLHGGIIHLLSNIMVQLDTCAFWEKEWGSACWFVVYLTSGLGSSILSVVFKPNNISVGSSGAVMGLFGAKLAEVLCRCRESSRTLTGRVGRNVRYHQLSAVLCTVILVGAFSFVPYVDWAAHLGGFLSGLCVGTLIFSFWIKNRFCFVFWCCVGIAATVVYYTLGLQYMYKVEPNKDLEDVCTYYQQYFEDYECHCRLQARGGGR